MSETSSPKNEEVPVKSSIDIEEKGVVHYNFDKSFQQLLSKKIIWILMILISLSHALIYISPGILSSCITQIKIELDLSDEEFGMFGTINGFGALIGSLVFTLIIEKVNHKVLITSALIVNCICHIAFYLKLSYTLLLYSRFISGFNTIFCFTYYPQWVDKFGILHWVNFMQPSVQISTAFGIVLGYFIY